MNPVCCSFRVMQQMPIDILAVRRGPDSDDELALLSRVKLDMSDGEYSMVDY